MSFQGHGLRVCAPAKTSKKGTLGRPIADRKLFSLFSNAQTMMPADSRKVARAKRLRKGSKTRRAPAISLNFLAIAGWLQL
jgi:hypothetical protein